MNELKKLLRLTPLQWEVLSDRLVQSDYLYEVYCDTYNKDYDTLEDMTFYDICVLLEEGKISEANKINANFTKFCIIDAVEGNTYYGSLKGNVSEHKLAAIGRSCEKLANRVSELFNKEVTYPLH